MEGTTKCWDAFYGNAKTIVFVSHVVNIILNQCLLVTGLVIIDKDVIIQIFLAFVTAVLPIALDVFICLLMKKERPGINRRKHFYDCVLLVPLLLFLIRIDYDGETISFHNLKVIVLVSIVDILVIIERVVISGFFVSRAHHIIVNDNQKR